MQPNKIRPTNRLEAIKWNYYNSDSWDFIKIRYWPWDIAKAVISKNLSYVMRFRWYLYLVGNGMDPAMARDVVKRELSHSKDKQMHIDSLYRDLVKNKNKWSYWDENQRKILKIDDTYVDDNEEYNRMHNRPSDGRFNGNNLFGENTRKKFTGINTTKEWLKDFQEKSKDYDYDDGTYESEVSDAEDFY